MKIHRTLLIDDTDIDQKLYQRVIKRSGLVEEVVPFLYADEALEFLKSKTSEKPDLILLDINMPRMNGFEFLEAAANELGDMFAYVVIVMLTTSLNPTDRARATRFEIVRDFINKPLTVDQVRHASELVNQARGQSMSG